MKWFKLASENGGETVWINDAEEKYSNETSSSLCFRSGKYPKKDVKRQDLRSQYNRNF